MQCLWLRLIFSVLCLMFLILNHLQVVRVLDLKVAFGIHAVNDNFSVRPFQIFYRSNSVRD